MAEYRALAQNTYKFVNEHTFYCMGDVSLPSTPVLGKMKLIINNSELLYGCLNAYKTATNAGANIVTIYEYTRANMSSSTSSSIRVNDDFVAKPFSGACVVDGKKYYGSKNSVYVAKIERTANTENSAALPDDWKLPAGKAKIIMYSEAENAIVGAEIRFDGKHSASLSTRCSSGNVGLDCYALRYAYIQIVKAGNDIILGIEFEYPKYDVTLSGTGIQYSLDDGVTFQDVTEGLALEQIEHVIFKNTDTVAHNIGTTDGGTDVATIEAGETYVAVPEADGTLYIS